VVLLRLLTLLFLLFSTVQNTKVHEAVSTMAAQSLRCVALAYREVLTSELDAGPEGQEAKKGSVPEDHLCLLAILGIKVRPWRASMCTPFSLVCPCHGVTMPLCRNGLPSCDAVTQWRTRFVV